MENEYRQRAFPAQLELVQEAADGSESTPARRIAGLSIPTNERSLPVATLNGRKVFEVIAPEAIESALKRNRDAGETLIMKWNHDPHTLLASTENGSLRVRMTDRGLESEADLPDTQLARDVATLVAGGYVTKQSFGYVPLRERASFDSATDSYVMTVQDMVLVEISPVAQPAFRGTDLSTRSRSAIEALGEHEGPPESTAQPHVEPEQDAPAAMPESYYTLLEDDLN